jgi:plasmid stabilization system protein ParE
VSPRLVFRPQARLEIAEAFRWYESRTPGLGIEFLDALELTLDAIRMAPDRFPELRPARRRAIVRRFPFSIIFDGSEDAICVFACHHHRRSPRPWPVREEILGAA